jgi:cell division protein ZapA
MSEARSETVNVKIYDREYAVRTSEDPCRLSELCNELDKRMREVAKGSGSVDTLKVAILTALSLTDELMRSREALRKMDETVGRRSLECVTMLDRFLY